jgi:hypothetical protein
MIAECVLDRFTEGDAEVLGRVVAVDFHVSLRFDLHVERAVPRELIDHVRQKRQRGIDRAQSGAVEIDLDPDIGLARLALDHRAAQSPAHLNSSIFQRPCSRTNSTVLPVP